MAFDVLRSLVAGKRRRFRDETFSLDLAYITPRVIAMSLPGEGAASSYRNPIDEVVRFLYMRHGTHFRIFNLAERTYDYSRFPAGAVVEAGFPDLNTCPLHVAINLARQMHEFLALAPRNVVAVHCGWRGAGCTDAQRSALLTPPPFPPLSRPCWQGAHGRRHRRVPAAHARCARRAVEPRGPRSGPGAPGAAAAAVGGGARGRGRSCHQSRHRRCQARPAACPHASRNRAGRVCRAARV